MALIILLAFSLLLQGALGTSIEGELVCDYLPVGKCAFAIASSGNRCLLETLASTSSSSDETRGLQCKTSDIVAGNDLHEHIETDECTIACGLDRKSIGMSSENLLEYQFIIKLCSPQCQQHCLNVVDLYHNLALGEGVYLPELCETLEKSPRRLMTATRVLSSGAASATASTVSEVALAPASDELFSESLIGAPAPM